MGERLGRGQTLEQARNEMVMVSEGFGPRACFNGCIETAANRRPS